MAGRRLGEVSLRPRVSIVVLSFSPELVSLHCSTYYYVKATSKVCTYYMWLRLNMHTSPVAYENQQLITFVKIVILHAFMVAS